MSGKSGLVRMCITADGGWDPGSPEDMTMVLDQLRPRLLQELLTRGVIRPSVTVDMGPVPWRAALGLRGRVVFHTRDGSEFTDFAQTLRPSHAGFVAEVDQIAATVKGSVGDRWLIIVEYRYLVVAQ